MQKQEKHSQAAVLGLQHLLAMYSGSILVPIMIATALGYSAEQLTYLISTDIFMCGVATFLQLQLNKYFGIGLPVVLGVAFQSVAPLIMIGQSHGSGAMFGALIVSGIYVVLISGIFSKVANLFPSIVTGSVITTIGLTLIPVAIGNMGNNVPEPTGQSLLLAAITVLIIPLNQHLYQRIYQVYLYFDWFGCWNCHCCYHGLGGLLSCCSSTTCPCPNSTLLWDANL